ncbi:MAG TPA: glycosyltransferase family 2 protein [Allosphingosinicella sp.]|nr:glycosyltransferase family 2 protein [Allosphingosinicella sp.]
MPSDYVSRREEYPLFPSNPHLAERHRIAVVVPSFRATRTIGAVLRSIGPEVTSIYVVDDGCPDATGERVLRDHEDPRLVVLRNGRNLGVGGAMKHGYRRALADGADLVVKLDADGQMDPRHIPRLIAPLLAGTADYAKGNRFAPAESMPPGSAPSALRTMPLSRLAGNRVLSALHRAATGYWRIGDPANGYTAIHARALERIGVEALADCFYFETDMLFRLNLVDAVVADIPLPACYPGSGSSLSLRRVAPRFALMTATRFVRRLPVKYFTGAWNIGSVKLAASLAMIAAAAAVAGWRWLWARPLAGEAGVGAAELSFLLLGLALLAAALLYDANKACRVPLSRRDPIC